MMQITSPSNPSFRRALRLHESRGRKQQGRIIIFGENEIRRALAAGVSADQMFVSMNRMSDSCNQLIESLQDSNAAVMELPDDLYSKLCFGNRVDEMVLVAKRPDTDLTRFKGGVDSLCVVLEGIEKPGNVGAVFRSAVAAGVDSIFLADPITDVYHPNSIRSSLGSVFAASNFVGTSVEIRDLLISNGIQVIAARVDAQTHYTEVNLSKPTAFVVGNEHSGLSSVWSGPEVTGVSIPMEPYIDSLNVAMSATLLTYEARRQRSR